MQPIQFIRETMSWQLRLQFYFGYRDLVYHALGSHALSRFYVVTPTNASTLCIDPIHRLGQCNQHMNNAITRTRYC